ncbi:MAG: A/G-specific adenine glycosylase, partial [Deferrisomatales bacterium]
MTRPANTPDPPDAPRLLPGLAAAVPGLHDWYRAVARPLPWRATRDPYAIWVSEVMLQQTRVATATPYYLRWLAAFPDLAALATADEHRVLLAWEGLGYYSRARNLHRAARVVAEDHGGEVPRDPAEFRRLPGVGPYTAAAVLSLAFGEPLAAVDGNVRRVVARLAALAGDPRAGAPARVVDELAQGRHPPAAAGRHNQALMVL